MLSIQGLVLNQWGLELDLVVTCAFRMALQEPLEWSPDDNDDVYADQFDSFEVGRTEFVRVAPSALLHRRLSLDSRLGGVQLDPIRAPVTKVRSQSVGAKLEIAVNVSSS